MPTSSQYAAIFLAAACCSGYSLKAAKRNSSLFALGVLAHPVAVGVAVARVLEDLLGLLGVVGVLLVLGDLVVPDALHRRDQRGAGRREAAHRGVDDRLLVDRVVHGLADGDVEQERVALGRLVVPAVEAELDEADGRRLRHRGAGPALEVLVVAGRPVDDRLEVAGLVVLDHRVHVLREDVPELVELRRSAELLRVVRVGHELDPLVLLHLVEDERARAHERDVLVVLEVVVGDVLPDVLGQDRDVERQHAGVRLLAGDDEGRVVGRLDLLDADEVLDVGPVLGVEDAVVGVGDVVRRQWLAVAPLHALTDGEGPDLAVGGGRPLAGEVGGRLVVLVVPGEEVVAEAERVPRGAAPVGERVEAVVALGDAEAVDELAARSPATATPSRRSPPVVRRTV